MQHMVDRSTLLPGTLLNISTFLKYIKRKFCLTRQRNSRAELLFKMFYFAFKTLKNGPAQTSIMFTKKVRKKSWS